VTERDWSAMLPCAARLRDLRAAGAPGKYSGAVFLRATWVDEADAATPAIVKVGAHPREVWWAEALAREAPDLIPTLFASGTQLEGEEETPWLVMEHCAFGLGPQWGGREFDMLLEAGARFQLVSRRVLPAVTAADVDFARHAAAIRRGLDAAPPAAAAAAAVVGGLEADWAWVSAVCRTELCHGDLHMTNVVSRTGPPEGRALLIDPAPQPIPWAFEPAYCQVLNSTDRTRIGYTGLVAKMAAVRTRLGLETGDAGDLDRLSAIVLAWQALRLWALVPERHTIADYVAETARYLEEAAESWDGPRSARRTGEMTT
jgi:hypothetical protein